MLAAMTCRIICPIDSAAETLCAISYTPTRCLYDVQCYPPKTDGTQSSLFGDVRSGLFKQHLRANGAPASPQGLTEYERRFNRGGGYVHAEELNLGMQRMDFERVAETESSLNLGCFWPLEIYKQRKGKMPPPKEIVSHEHMGQVLQGVLLDPATHGQPVGSIMVRTVTRNKITKSMLAAHEAAGDDVRGLWASTVPSLQHKAQSDKRSGKVVATHAAQTMPKRVPVDSDMCDDANGLPLSQGSASSDFASGFIGAGGSADASSFPALQDEEQQCVGSNYL